MTGLKVQRPSHPIDKPIPGHRVIDSPTRPEIQGNDRHSAVADIRANLAQMQSTIDSLTLVVAKQDSSIAKLAVATNVQIIK